MDIQKHTNPNEDPWQSLKQFTAARIALGSTGVALPLNEVLQFRMAHAHARDAVHALLNVKELTNQLQQSNLPFYVLQTQAKDRTLYLQRPDLGRQLDEASVKQLQDNQSASDIVIVIADGLSARAVNDHAMAVLQLLMPMFQSSGLSLSPIVLIQQARVAVSDPVGALLTAKMTLIFIGERPGLSSPDSMGVYLTYNPIIGLTDDSRNCISNIRPEGLNYTAAADKIFYLVTEAFRLKHSGIALKDNAGLL